MAPLSTGIENIEKIGLLKLKKYSTIPYRLCFRFGVEQGRTSRGDSGALYPQSATAGMNPGPRTCDVPSALDK